MKHIKMIVEVDLGVVLDEFKVTPERCQDQIRIGELITAPYTILEVRTIDTDTNLIADLCVPEGEE